MDLLLVGAAAVGTLGIYLVVASGAADPRARRRRGLAVGYGAVGALTLAVGVLLVGVTFDGGDPSNPDGSFAGGIVSTLDDAVFLVAGGWALTGGAAILVGAVAGRRGWPLARLVLVTGLLVIGLPGLLVGVGLIYLLAVPTVLLWRREPALD